MAEKRALTNCATAAVSVRNHGGGARWPAPREAAQHATASGASLLSLAEQLL